MIFSTESGNFVEFHSGSDHSFPEDCAGKPALLQAIKYLESYPYTRPLDGPATRSADMIYDAEICLSPDLLVRPKLRLNPHFCEYFVLNSDFGLELFMELGRLGAFDFLDNISTERSRAERRMVWRVLSVFVMSGRGLGSLDSVPVEYVLAVVHWFRTDNRLTWRKDLVGDDPSWRRCLRQIVMGLFRCYDDPRLLANAGVRRSGGRQGETWRSFEHSLNALQRELFERMQSIEASYTQQAALDVYYWLDAEGCGDSTLVEIFRAPPRSQTFSSYLINRTKNISKHVLERTQSAQKICHGIIHQLSSEYPVETFEPLISDEEISYLKNNLSPNSGKGQQRARPLPPVMHELAKEIWDGGEHGWPGTGGGFSATVPIDGTPTRIYCPVVPTLIRSAFDLPLRMAQWRRLDSGEGDLRRYNGNLKQWEINTGPLAGYWEDQDGNAGSESRGYARWIVDGDKTLTGFFINTNKTGSPHNIPWQHDELHQRLWELRLWQEKYNPISRPISPEEYVDKPFSYPEATKLALPDIFPLFRLFPNNQRPISGRLITTSELHAAWAKSMAELERVWNEKNPDKKVSIVRYQEQTGQPQTPIYTLHGLRARGLTDLYRAGTPIEVVSRIVAGHATIRMFFQHYYDYGPAMVNEQLQAAAANEPSARQLMGNFTNGNLEEVRARTVSLDPAARDQAAGETTAAEVCGVDIGFCPWDCSRCHDGGEILRTVKPAKGQHLYGSVPGGKRNCILCRHFVSGPPWIPQLEMYGTKLYAKRTHLARREHELNDAIQALHDQRRSEGINPAHFEMRRASLTSELRTIQEDVEIVEKSLFNLNIILTASISTLDEQTIPDGETYIALSRDSIIEYMEVSDIETSLYLTAASRVYPILHDERLEKIRNEYLDIVMFDAGIHPAHLHVSVTQEQRERALDLYGHLLLEQVQRCDLEALGRRQLRLQDIGLDGSVRRVIESAINEPIMLSQTKMLQTNLPRPDDEV